jgi:hypothetical protein
MAAASVFFFREPAWYEEKAAKKNLTAEAKPHLERTRQALAALGRLAVAEAIHALIQALAEQAGVGMGKIAQPIRVAVSGRGVSPPIDQTLAILGAGRPCWHGSTGQSPTSREPRRPLTAAGRVAENSRLPRGAIAQLGERLHGMQEVDGSIPSGSTNFMAYPRPHRLEA